MREESRETNTEEERENKWLQERYGGVGGEASKATRYRASQGA